MKQLTFLLTNAETCHKSDSKSATNLTTKQLSAFINPNFRINLQNLSVFCIPFQFHRKQA
jgi:hypothetical protein